ncbi:MAG: DsbA family oxidoreductase [Bryobacteraceae bacterium]|nr:DsbA family oxidoreductase [Bryobacteraceae bacterium]
MLDLTVVSDVICPWCYVGKKNLERALVILGPALCCEITWRPYELNPTMPAGGMDRWEYRSKKFGSWAHSQSLDAQVAAAGAQAGIHFRHDLIVRTPNTFQAHRLIWLAGQEGVQNRVVEGLFRAYFTEGRDVGDAAVLTELAVEAGLDRRRTAVFLESDEGSDALRQQQERLRDGVSGVPSFHLDGEFLFSGALKPELIASHLRQAACIDAER